MGLVCPKCSNDDARMIETIKELTASGHKFKIILCNNCAKESLIKVEENDNGISQTI